MNRSDFKTFMRKQIGGEEFDRKVREGWVFKSCACGSSICMGWRFEPDMRLAPRRANVMTGTMDDNTIRRTVT